MCARHKLIPQLVGDFSYVLKVTGIAYHSKQEVHALVQVVDQKAIEAVSERLRDTKRSVRRDATVHLMAVFRLAACIACGFALSFWHTRMLCSSQTMICHIVSDTHLFMIGAKWYSSGC